MIWNRVRLSAALVVCLGLAVASWSGPVARANHDEAPTIVEDFENGIAEWTGSGLGAGSWTTVFDPQSPAAAKHVLANADGQVGRHAAFWNAITVTTNFRLEATLKGSVSGGWIGLTLGHHINPDRYLVARVQVGGRKAELVKYPENQVLASGTLPGAGGCAEDPVIPAGQYVRIALEIDDAGIAHIHYEGVQLAAIPLPLELQGGGHPGVYYSGGSSYFEDVSLRGFAPAPTLSAAVTVNAANRLYAVPDGLFGAFMVWLAESNGFKLGNVSWDSARDNLEKLHELLPMIADMGLRTLRFNGGKLANSYLWQEHIGPHDEWALAQELTLDDFMQFAENLGARAIVNVNASDSPIWGLGTYLGARYAADMVEYLTVADDGSNPDPDGLAPNDPDNFNWARLRADHGHREPFPIIGFEVGNELRGPPFLSGTPASVAYANRFVEFASAMKAVNPHIAVGAVGEDNFLDADFADWYDTLHSTFESSDCDWLPQDGVAVECADFWIRHVLVPSPSAPTPNAVGVTFDLNGGAIDATVEVSAPGTYRLALAAYAVGFSGAWPQVDVEVDGGSTFGQVLDIQNNSPESHPAWPDMRIYETNAFTLGAGTHTVRLTRIGGGAGQRSLLLYPAVSLRDGSGIEAARVEMRDSPLLSKLLQATAAATRPGILAPESSGPGLVYGRPIIVTETSVNYESYNTNSSIPELAHYVGPMDPRAGDLREALMQANL
ncbi:MAG: hypothetical protein KC466_15170, partial [Myxococcales bacterium]|nr:hypothetical protein [Myxococcales bacterium]